MRRPMPPPDPVRLSATISHERLEAVRERLGPAIATRDYLPWDELRFRPAPEGVTHEEWWWALRSARRASPRTLSGLVDADGEQLTYNLPDALLENLERINRGASGSLTISEQVTNPATRDRYVVSSLIEEAITSSQLEGAATTRQVAKEMIRAGREPRDRSERMILNNYRAMRSIAEFREDALTPALVCEIHRIVTEGTLDRPENAGRLQDDDTDRVAVWSDSGELLHRPPPAAQLPDRLARLCAFANGESDSGYVPPALRAIAVHFMMGHDHYFEDGNGRTARAVYYWAMLHQGFWLTEFLTISRILKGAPTRYARAFLHTEQDGGDLTYFFLHQSDVIVRAIGELHAYLARKADELASVQRAVRSFPGEFTHRQLDLLEHAVRTPGARYSVQSHQGSHGVSTETARQDLLRLEAMGLLVRGKTGRRFTWSPAPDLPDRLETRARGAGG